MPPGHGRDRGYLNSIVGVPLSYDISPDSKSRHQPLDHSNMFGFLIFDFFEKLSYPGSRKPRALPVDECASVWPGCRPTRACSDATGYARGAPQIRHGSLSPAPHRNLEPLFPLPVPPARFGRMFSAQSSSWILSVDGLFSLKSTSVSGCVKRKDQREKARNPPCASAALEVAPLRS